jgi:hypothetical protein
VAGLAGSDIFATAACNWAVDEEGEPTAAGVLEADRTLFAMNVSTADGRDSMVAVLRGVWRGSKKVVVGRQVGGGGEGSVLWVWRRRMLCMWLKTGMWGSGGWVGSEGGYRRRPPEESWWEKVRMITHEMYLDFSELAETTAT